MEICYKAFDGKIFKSEKDCAAHEADFRDKVRMYSKEGVENHGDNAIVLALLSNDSASAFINKCRLDNSLSDGIMEGDTGIFLWIDDEYILLEDEQLGALRQYFKHEDGEK